MRYSYLSQKAAEIYDKCQANAGIRVVWKRTKNIFRYSFFGKITETKDMDNLRILNNSKVIKWLLGAYETWSHRLNNFCRSSIVCASIGETKKDLYFLPIKTIGVILVTAILINTLCSLLSIGKIGLVSWVARGLFLFIGISGLSCDASYEDIKRTSIVFKGKKR